MCFLAQFDDTPCMMRADGQFDRAHLIQKQRIKVALRSRGFSQEYIEEAVWSPEIWRHACRRHHARYDSLFILLDFEDYPDSVSDWAREHSFYWHSPKRGWVALAAGSLAGREAA